MSGDGAGLVRRLDEVGADDRPDVGGKGASLGELIRAEVRVPPGFVVTTVGFRRALETIDADGAARRRLREHDPDDPDLARTAEEMRERVLHEPLPDDLREAIAGSYAELAGGDEDLPVAVRSSATGEDAPDASFAGLQETSLWVRGSEEVVEHVRRCWASLYSLESVTYRLRRGIPEEGLAMAVVVQEMVDARCSGVMFTCSPTTGDRSVVAIEVGWGLGSAMVSGDVTPDSLVVNKVTGEVVRREIATKTVQHRMDLSGHGVVTVDVPDDLRTEACLNDEQIEVLVELARRVENHYGVPQDIEWAIPEGGDETEVLLLQSRPETVWQNRAAEPVAAPKARAFDHVLGVLGGGQRKDRDGGGE